VKARLPVVFVVLCALLAAALTAPLGVRASTPLLPPPIFPEIDPVVSENYRPVYALPLYRLKYTVGGTTWHVYTTGEAERAARLAMGYVDDGIVTYVSPIKLPGTLALNRWVYSGRTYFLSASPSTNAGDFGYSNWGPVGYVYPPMTAAPPSGQQNIYRYMRTVPAGDSQWFSDNYYTPDSAWPKPANYRARGATFRAWSDKKIVQKITLETIGPDLVGWSTVNIKWSVLQSFGVVELLYSVDEGATWQSIVKNRPAADGQYEWTVPNLSAAKVYVMAKWSTQAGYPALATMAGFPFKITRNLSMPIFLLPPIIIIDLPPAAPTNLTAAGIGLAPEIKLTWEDNSTVETGFVIERKTGSGPFAGVGTAAADATSYSDTGVAPGTVYTYRVKAKGSVTDSTYSNEAEGVYLAAPETEVPMGGPESPSGLQAVQLTGLERIVRLTWTKSVTPGVLGYVVERNVSGPWVQIVDLPATAATHLDGELADPSITAASYRVMAYDEFALSAPAEATLTLTAPPAFTFDGTQSGWAEAELVEAYLAGLTYPGIMSQFGRPITREEFCTIAVKLYEKLTGLVAVPGLDPFEDTDNPEVLKAYGLDIVRGMSATVFAPYDNITRQQMCVMIFRAIKAAGKSTDIPSGGSFPFNDAGSIAAWAINEVRFCYHHVIMKGTSPTTISPGLNTPREQAIILLLRAYNAFK